MNETPEEEILQGFVAFCTVLFFTGKEIAKSFYFFLDFFVHYVMMILGMLVDQSHFIMMCYLVTSDPLIQH